MVRYIVAVHKGLTIGENRQNWSNVYHVEAINLSDALDVGMSISNVEQDVHKDYVAFRRVTAVEDQPDPPPGGSRQLTGLGQVTGDMTKRLPGFNTVRVLFSDGNGRPSQKYLRLPLEEDDIVEGTLNTTIVNLLVLSYTGPMMGISGVVSNTGDPWTEANVVFAVQMRQQDWKRRSRAGFIRGWVPV